jgi:hypothetical protein
LLKLGDGDGEVAQHGGVQERDNNV